MTTDAGTPSRTAERVALERAAHQLIDSPIVLADPLAIRVIARDEAERLRAHPERHDRSPIHKPTRAIVVVRSRITEEEVARAVAAGATASGSARSGASSSPAGKS